MKLRPELSAKERRNTGSILHQSNPEQTVRLRKIMENAFVLPRMTSGEIQTDLCFQWKTLSAQMYAIASTAKLQVIADN